MTTLQTALTTVTTVTASATLAAGKHTPVDATSGALTMTLPVPARAGARLRVEKIDATTNTVTVTGTIRGAATSLTLLGQYDQLEFVAESTSSWRIGAQHRPKLVNDMLYPAKSATAPYLRGVNTQGGGGNVDDGNQVPGTLGVNYWYNSQNFYNYIASRGHTIVRIDFLWERVQPTLGGALSSGITDLQNVVQYAANAGLQVILDMKNYGRYWNNSTTRVMFDSGITSAWYADAWSKIATAFASQPAVVGWGLMNEPHDLPVVPPTTGPSPANTTWKVFSQAAVTAIRATGDTRDVYVAGDQFGGLWNWANYNGTPWITDSANAVVYEAHLYLDHDRSGSYVNSYATEEAADKAGGWLSLQQRVLADCDVFLGWLKKYNARGFIGEVGWPSGADATAWNAVAEQAYRRFDAAGVGVTYWATGENLSGSGANGMYPQDLYWRNNFVPQAQATVVEAPTHQSRPGTKVTAVKAIETAPKLNPTGVWNFSQTPTVAGSAIGGSSTPEYTIGSGLWWAPSTSATGTGSLGTLNVMILAPLRLPAATGLGALAVEVATAGTTGGLLRAGFYGSTANGTPDMSNLLVDLGTVASTTTGIKTFTPGSAVTLPKGMVWFALVAQTATCTVRTSTGANEIAMPYPSGVNPSAGSNIQVLNVGGVSAGLPTSGSPGAGTILIAPPKLWLQGA